MEESQAVNEAMWHARRADEGAERLLLTVSPVERTAQWAEELSSIVRDARVALRTTISYAVSAATLAEMDQLEMRLRLLAWHAVEAGCALRVGETLPGD